MDFNPTLQILRLDRSKQWFEPLKRPKITTNPKEIHLSQTRSLLRVVHLVPYTLQNRRKGRDSNTSANQHGNLVLEHIFGGTAKGSVNVHLRKNAADRRVVVATLAVAFGGGVYADNRRPVGVFGASRCVKITAKCACQRLCKSSDASDVHRYIVFFWRTGEREWVVLPKRDLRAAKEDVLRNVSFTSLSGGESSPVQLSFLSFPFLFESPQHYLDAESPWRYKSCVGRESRVQFSQPDR